MAKDTQYKSLSWLFDSRGLMARPANDRPPDQHFYINEDGIFEREESALSSRYGHTILNRSAAGSGTSNYPLPSQPVTLARMIYQSQAYRYAALANGSLYRLSGNAQGQYLPLSLPSAMSGDPMTVLINTVQGSAQPWAFFYDRQSPCKDNGTGSPSRVGIFGPTVPVTSTVYAPGVLIVDQFSGISGYNPTGMTLVGQSIVAAVNATSGTSILSGNYFQYQDSTKSYAAVPDGMIAFSVNNPDGVARVKFNTPLNPSVTQYDIVALNSAYSTTDTFDFKAVSFSIASNSTGYIGKTVSLNLGNYQAQDLVVIALQVTGTAAIQEIRVEFDVNNSGYTSSYYYKSLIPVSYEGSIAVPQTNDPTAAVVNTVFARAIGITNLNQSGYPQILPLDDPSVGQVQPSQVASGDGAWSVIYVPLGQFLPVGNAGDPNAGWANITGWQVQVTTNNQGSATVAFNGIYVQGSPTSNGVNTNAGASSYGGVGYDFRYTYFDFNTFTESNPCSQNYFSTAQWNPAGVSTLFPLRQAIDLALQGSADPQVTHLRVYARGGVYGDNWRLADQVVNPGNTVTHYRYIIPDQSLAQGQILNLANDVPVTSTLPNPVITTLMDDAIPSPQGLNIPTLVTVNVVEAFTFVPNQVVLVGDPQDLEYVIVVTGGVGQFSFYTQLRHNHGEQVQVFSEPGVPCYLVASAYGQWWMAGDPNNPHYLYYTPPGYPENCPPQNYIPCGTATDPITAVINNRGTLFVRTNSTFYQIFPGSPPYAQSTGSKHGSPANFDWCLAEGGFFYQSWDGIRFFQGSEGIYMSLLIEWLYRDNSLTPVELVNLNLLGNVISAFQNTDATFVYTGQDGNQHRLRWNTSYKRWRNDDLQVSAILTEPDTNQLVMAIPYPGLPAGNWCVVYEDITKDYDDGGWQTVAGQTVLVQTPIPVTLQTPFLDIGTPNNQKQWNSLTLDIDPNNQTIIPSLVFDDGTASPPTGALTPSTITGTARQKFEFQINAGFGVQAYRASLMLAANVTAAPIFYQADLFAAVLAEQRASWDSYWQSFSSDESKLVKQCFIDYTTADGNPITVQLFADGNANPYFQFQLQANTARYEVPTRVRFPAIKLRLFRMVMTSNGVFQIWNPVQVDQKTLRLSTGFARTELTQGLG